MALSEVCVPHLDGMRIHTAKPAWVFDLHQSIFRWCRKLSVHNAVYRKRSKWGWRIAYTTQ